MSNFFKIWGLLVFSYDKSRIGDSDYIPLSGANVLISEAAIKAVKVSTFIYIHHRTKLSLETLRNSAVWMGG